MARVKRGVTVHQKHKKILRATKGYQFGRSKLIKQAKEAMLHAGQYAFAGRKQRRRNLRRLWITQMNNLLKEEGLSYSKFIAALKAKNILLNRKVLAEIAITDPLAFKQIIAEIK